MANEESEHGQSKYWCFTLNNYTEEDEEKIQGFVPESATYLVYGRERAPSTGTPHLQGYVELKKRLRRNQLHGLFPRISWRRRRGTPDQASNYCKKEDTSFFEAGTISRGQGARSDLLEVKDSISNGANILDIADNYFGAFVKYEKSLRSYMLMKRKRQLEAPQVIIYWGNTGTGKTRKVFDENPHHQIYSWPGDKWFDGYIGEDIILLDEFSDSQLPLTFLLRLLDRYPFKLPVKGGFVQLLATKFFITSNVDPELWYANAHPEHRAALFRRVTNIIKFE